MDTTNLFLLGDWQYIIYTWVLAWFPLYLQLLWNGQQMQTMHHCIIEHGTNALPFSSSVGQCNVYLFVLPYDIPHKITIMPECVEDGSTCQYIWHFEESGFDAIRCKISAFSLGMICHEQGTKGNAIDDWFPAGRSWQMQSFLDTQYTLHNHPRSLKIFMCLQPPNFDKCASRKARICKKNKTWRDMKPWTFSDR